MEDSLTQLIIAGWILAVIIPILIIALSGFVALIATVAFVAVNIAFSMGHIPQINVGNISKHVRLVEVLTQISVVLLMASQMILGVNSTAWIPLLFWDILGIALSMFWGYVLRKVK